MPQLRINLLPAYFAEKRKTNAAILLASLLFAAALIGPLAYFAYLQPQVVAREGEADEMERRAQAVTAYKAETQQIRDQVKPIQDKVDFVEAVRFYNGWVQKIYRRAAQYTIREVEYSAMNVQGNTLTINGYANNSADLGRYLITFFGNPDVSAVSISGPPGWRQPGQQGAAGGGVPGGVPGGATDPFQGQSFTQQRPREGFPFTVTATLIQSIRRPQLPATLNESTAGGVPGGVPGMPPGMDPGAMGPGVAPPPDMGGPPPDAAGPPPDGAPAEDE